MANTKVRMTKVTAVTRYCAEDGTEFHTPHEAENYNIIIALKSKVIDWVHYSLNDDGRDSDESFITTADVVDAILRESKSLLKILLILQTGTSEDTAIVPRKATAEMVLTGVKRMKDTVNKSSIANLWDAMVSTGESK